MEGLADPVTILAASNRDYVGAACLGLSESPFLGPRRPIFLAWDSSSGAA
jgi:hypothetical protein